ncbi:MAG TPA: hypothetical protein VGC53_09440 [Vicinamibacteria bacterium]|jgi:hypothetical protein
MKADYLPGQRNIGPDEVRRRRRLGFIGAAASVLCFFLLLWADAPRFTRVLLSFPILMATLGFVQAHHST